jgi:hypothetical protein
MDTPHNQPSGADLFSNPLPVYQQDALPTAPTAPDATFPPEPKRRDPFARRPYHDRRAHRLRNFFIPALLVSLGWGGISAMTWWQTHHDAPLPIDWRAFGDQQVPIAIPLLAGCIITFIYCILTAPLVSATFGNLFTAIIRIAAVSIFPTAVSYAIPYLGTFFLQPLLVWILLCWFFELEPLDGFFWGIILAAAQYLTIALLLQCGVSIAHQFHTALPW